MTSQDQNQPMLFTAEDRLHLLQLSERRAIVDRRKKARDKAARGGAEPEDAPVPALQYPSHWKLVPDAVSLYDWQQLCLPLWLANGRGTIKVATGGGKTLFALAAAQRLQSEREPDLRLVVVVPTIPLMWQWYDEVRKGNLPIKAIGLMGGGQEIENPADIRILICVLASARDRLPQLVRTAGWAHRMLLVVDECHRSAAAQSSRIFDSQPRFTLGLSATPEPGMDEDSLPTDVGYEASAVGQALGPIIFDFTLRQSLAAGLLTPFEVWHIGLELSPKEATEHSRLSREIGDLRMSLQVQHRRARSQQGFIAWCQTQASRGGAAATEAGQFINLANRRKRLLFSAEARVAATLEFLAESILDPDSRSIVFHESIEHIEDLFVEAVSRGIPAVLEHSELPDSLRAEAIDAFRLGTAKTVISAKSLIEGFNVPSADLGVIAASSSSVRQRIQSLGRMLRRKDGQRQARIMVLYVKDTEDEAIYEKADWEAVIGAERNRYFTWQRPSDDSPWPAGLEETGTAPRRYRPPASDIDVTEITPEDPYPGQIHGLDVKVDQDNNLRSEDGGLIAAPRELIEAIVLHNSFRRARITPAGHLIVRSSNAPDAEVGWLFIGLLNPDLPSIEASPEPPGLIRLKLQSSRGRRVISRGNRNDPDGLRFARGAALPAILTWINELEAQRHRQVHDLYWDGASSYWVEVDGERVACPGDPAPLEFEG